LPIFEYRCGRCGAETSFLVLRRERAIRRCESCGSDDMQRLISRVYVASGSADESALRARPRDFLQRPERLEQAMKALEVRTGVKLNREQLDGAMHRLSEAKSKM
jgi:putative FmdB family regulatory protein